jgi:hypothetical protein
VVRRLAPLGVIIFLCSFSCLALAAFVLRAQQQMWTLFLETHQAIEKIQPGTPNLDAAHPLQLTGEDLAKAYPLSDHTRHWLEDARITIAPDKPHPGRYCCGENSGGITFAPDRDYSWYLATIHLEGGSACTLSFEAGRGYGIVGGVCN